MRGAKPFLSPAETGLGAGVLARLRGPSSGLSPCHAAPSPEAKSIKGSHRRIADLRIESPQLPMHLLVSLQ
jgi:hypothetical protein